MIIMTDEKLRTKFSFLLDWRVQAFLIANATAGLLIFAAVMQNLPISRQPKYCLGHTPGQNIKLLVSVVFQHQ